MVSTRNQRKASGEELLGPLLVHRKPRSKRDNMTGENKQDTSSDGDRITKLEQQVENLSASILKLVESLKTGKSSRPSTSSEPDQKLKKKVVEDSEDEDDIQADPTKKEAESVGYEDERWYKWQHFRQRFGQPVQEYTTEFHNQAMVLDIDVDDYDVFMKYTGGLADYIRKELKLFTVDTIEDATVKAIAIEAKIKELTRRMTDQNLSTKLTGRKWGSRARKVRHRMSTVITVKPVDMPKTSAGYSIQSYGQSARKTTRGEMTEKPH
ncbi:unnamed protein product [Prunus armeniaca]